MKRSAVGVRVIQPGYLLALVIFIAAGTSLASFHGDEAMQVYMSSDYATAFIDRAPDRLLSYPPFDIDSDPHLRLINGSVNRYLIGLSWHAAGYSRESLPPRPGWNWGLNYTDNVNTGHRPDAAFMLVSRLSSALLTAMGALLMFAVGQRIGGTPVATLSSFLYAVHPVILINGRRAMQEGSMFAFGLLTVYAAVLIAGEILNGNGRQKWRPYGYWVLLIASGALTLASKHSGAIFVIGAYGWVGVAIVQRWVVEKYPLTPDPSPTQAGRGENGNSAYVPDATLKGLQPIEIEAPLAGLRPSDSRGFKPSADSADQEIGKTTGGRHRWRPYRRIGLLIASGVITLALWVALSPALWSDPAARIGDLLKARTELLEIQVAVWTDGPMPLEQRLIEIVRQPFIHPAQHFEVAFWGEIPEIQAEITAYMESPLSGLQFGLWLGGALTVLVAVGLARAGRKPLTVGLVVWVGVTALSLLANPLPWQRYYLPLIPPAILLTSLGVVAILGTVFKERKIF